MMPDDLAELAHRIAGLDPAVLRRLEDALAAAPGTAALAAPARAGEVVVTLRRGAGTRCVLAAPSTGDLRKLQTLARAMRERPIQGLLPPDDAGGLTGRALRDDLVARAVRELAPFDDGAPIVVGGFCLAGAFALCVADALARAGAPVAGVALIDTVFSASRWGRRLEHVREVVDYHAGALRGRPPGERLRYLAARLWAIPGYLQQRRAQQEWLTDASAADGAFATAVEAFRFTAPPPVTVPMLFVWSGEERQLTTEPFRQRAWKRVARAGLEWVTVPASHATMFDEARVGDLADCLERFIAGLQRA